MGRRRKNCPPELEGSLESMTVAEVCAQTGACSQIVRRWYRERGFTPARKARKKRGSPAWEEKVDGKFPGLLDEYGLGELTLAQIGEIYGVSREYVRQLGSAAGLTPLRVENREKLGVPRGRGRSPHPQRNRVLPLLGKLPDLDIAETIGAKVATVQSWRKKAGIPAAKLPFVYPFYCPEGNGIAECRWPGCARPPHTRGVCPTHRAKVSTVRLHPKRLRCYISDDMLLPPRRKGWPGKGSFKRGSQK